MRKDIFLPRNGCALHGALQTIRALNGIVPIVHATSGCAYQNFLANSAGSAGTYAINGPAIPGTTIQERHIIFGGASRLREQIKNTVKIIQGQLYIVLNSCPAAMVGDDIDAMCREAREQGENVIDSLSAGFHGDSHFGYDKILVDIFEQLPLVFKNLHKEKQARLVNIFGIVPFSDINYKGDLEEIKRILSGIGITANTFFNTEDSLEQLKSASSAELSIVFGEWGKNAAEKLNELYGVPVLSFDSIPVGVKQTINFIQSVSAKLLFTPDELSAAEKFLIEEQTRFTRYIQSVRELYYENHIARNATIVAQGNTALGIAKFLTSDFGITIENLIITDFYSSETLTDEQKALSLASIGVNIHFSSDAKFIEKIIRSGTSGIILASSLEEQAADDNDIPLLVISYPQYKRVSLTKTYAGINGALFLTEDLFSAVLSSNLDL